MKDQAQLELNLYPDLIDVDGYVDEARNVRYFGKAKRQNNGKCHALADVDGALCIVEATITEKKRDA